jgi:hypothetical protein
MHLPQTSYLSVGTFRKPRAKRFDDVVLSFRPVPGRSRRHRDEHCGNAHRQPLGCRKRLQGFSGFTKPPSLASCGGVAFCEVVQKFGYRVVMACDDEIIPLQERIETVGDDADLQEVYDTERHLLYVACTRARDHLLVCGIADHRSRDLAR